MASFRNDYGVLAHPRILEALAKANLNVEVPYGQDVHSHAAERMIKAIFGCPKANVHFIAGGTQTNLVGISLMLNKSFECVIAVETGHINVHETGAIEGSGHKVVTIPGIDGKATPENVRKACRYHCDEHMVLPKALYISNSTEIGTIYSKEELLALRKVCDELGLYLFMDGARLGAALTSEENDVPASLLGSICDAFYVGGTKNGLLFGEALVLVNERLQENARYLIKNKGAMLAKGYAVGIEFEEAFKDGLYFELAKHTNEMAKKLIAVFEKLGLKVPHSPTNQVFVCFDKSLAERLIERFGCERWAEKKEGLVIRFVTSFATTQSDIDELEAYLSDNK